MKNLVITKNSSSLFFLTALLHVGYAGETAQEFLRQNESFPAQEPFDRLKVRIEEEERGSKEHKILLDAALQAFHQVGIDNVRRRLAQKLGKGAEDQGKHWEFRSYMAIGGEAQFSLHQPADDLSFWAGLGDSRHGITIVEFDPDQKLLTVQEGEVVHKLPLQSGSISASPDQDDQNNQWHAELRQAWPEFKAKWEQATTDFPEIGEMRNDYLTLKEEIEERRQNREKLLRAVPTVSERIRVAREDEAEMRELETERDRIYNLLERKVMQLPDFAQRDYGKIRHFLAHGEPPEQ